MVKKLFYCVLVLVMAGSAYAQINDWTGATSRDWMVPTNWSLGVVPNPTNTVNVRIDRGPANMPLISTGENASSGSGDTWAPEWAH